MELKNIKTKRYFKKKFDNLYTFLEEHCLFVNYKLIFLIKKLLF